MEGLIFFCILIGIAVIAALIYVDYLISSEFYEVAKQKGYTSQKYFWYCFFLGVVGYLIVIALVPKNGTVADSVKEDIPEI